MTDDETDVIIRETLNLARSLFPEQTERAEAWAAQRMTAYGIDYAKYKAQQLWSGANNLLGQPLVLLALGLLGGRILFGRR